MGLLLSVSTLKRMPGRFAGAAHARFFFGLELALRERLRLDLVFGLGLTSLRRTTSAWFFLVRLGEQRLHLEHGLVVQTATPSWSQVKVGQRSRSTEAAQMKPRAAKKSTTRRLVENTKAQFVQLDVLTTASALKKRAMKKKEKNIYLAVCSFQPCLPRVE